MTHTHTTETDLGEFNPIPKSSDQITLPRGYVPRGYKEENAGALAIAAKKDVRPNWKKTRIKDPKAITKCRAWGRCQKCGASKRTGNKVKLDAHHIETKAAGGGDVARNLILLCKPCHKTIHLCADMTRERMHELAEERDDRQKNAVSSFAVERLVKEQGEGK